MKRLIAIVATLFVATSAFGASFDPKTWCEKLPGVVEAVQQAKSFEALNDAMVSNGYQSYPADILRSNFNGELEMARSAALAALAQDSNRHCMTEPQ